RFLDHHRGAMALLTAQISMLTRRDGDGCFLVLREAQTVNQISDEIGKMTGAGFEAQRDTSQLFVVLHECHPVLNRRSKITLQYGGHTLCGHSPVGCGFASFRWMRSRSTDISIGFTRISSACKRMAHSASSSSGYPLRTSVTASGCVCRMALTTVNPSPACGMWRSERRASKVSEAMRLNASRTFATATTSKPSRSSVACNIPRTASSSSANKILGIPVLLSAPHKT